MAFFVGTDVGGTFTDLWVADATGEARVFKSPTTADVMGGVVSALNLAAQSYRLDFGAFCARIERFGHGTTVSLNALLTGRAAKTAVVTTQGFGDTLEIGRMRRQTAGLSDTEVTDYFLHNRHLPIIPRERIVEVNERIDANGTVVAPLDEQQAREQLRALKRDGIEAIAICTLWSTANPVHELRLKEIVAQELPGAFLSLSHEISSVVGEYGRMSTAAANAALGPIAGRYLARLEQTLRGAGMRVPILMMTNAGGVLPTDVLNDRPAFALFSGPAAGVIGSLAIGERIGAKNLLTTDIGGTSFDVGVVVDGRPLMRRDLETRDVVPMPGTDGAASPFFSPDSAWIGFWQDGAFRRMPARGGGADRIEPLVPAQMTFGAAWRSTGDLVYTPTNLTGLMLLPAGEHAARVLTDPSPANQEMSLRWPEALPDSRFVLFAVHRRPTPQIQAIDVTTGERHVVVENGTLARFAAPDRLIFSRDRMLMAAPFDPRSARVTGPAIELARGLSYYPLNYLAQFSVSATGVLAYLTEPTRIDRELVLVDRDGRVTPFGAPARPYIHPRLSPDGRRIALWLEADDTAEIWTYDLTTQQLTQQTTGGVSWRPVWSPDSQRLAFDARPSDIVNVFTLRLSPGATPQALMRRDRPQMAEDWLPDGRTLVMSQVEPETGRDLHLVNVDTRETHPLAHERGDEGGAAVSPGGRWVAYVWGEPNASAIYAVSTQADHPLRVRLAARGREPRWSRDGRELFFRDRGAMYSLPISEAHGTLTAGQPIELFRGEFDERPLPRESYSGSSFGPRNAVQHETKATPSSASRSRFCSSKRVRSEMSPASCRAM